MAHTYICIQFLCYWQKLPSFSTPRQNCTLKPNAIIYDYDQVYTQINHNCFDNVLPDLEVQSQSLPSIHVSVGLDVEPALPGTKEEKCGRVGEREKGDHE